MSTSSSVYDECSSVQSSSPSSNYFTAKQTKFVSSVDSNKAKSNMLVINFRRTRKTKKVSFRKSDNSSRNTSFTFSTPHQNCSLKQSDKSNLSSLDFNKSDRFLSSIGI